MLQPNDEGVLQDLCRRASTETDSAKLLELVKEINRMLDKRHTPESEDATVGRNAAAQRNKQSA